jgi:hypothetical protein
MSSVYVHTLHHPLYLRIYTPSSQSTYTPDHCLHSLRTHHNTVFIICLHTHIHTQTHTHKTHRIDSLRIHHSTVVALKDNDVQSPYDSEHGSGGLVWVGTIFSFLLTGKVRADKAAHNLATPKTIFRNEWSLGQTGLLQTTLHKKEPFLEAYLKITKQLADIHIV